MSRPHAIFLHDTNTRNVFAREERFLSHGCIRVGKPVELANILLGYRRFDDRYLATCPIDAGRQPLPKSVSVPVVYNVLDLDEAKVCGCTKTSIGSGSRLNCLTSSSDGRPGLRAV